MENIAHIRSDSREKQTLEDHLLGVANLASEFMAPLGLESAGRLVGLLHDLGKASRAFNDYIQGEGDYSRGEIDHSTAGASFLYRKEPAPSRENSGQITAFEMMELAIASHHSGLIDVITTDGDNNYSRRMEKTTQYRLDEYLTETAKDSGLDLDPALIQNAGNAICKKVYRLIKERNIPAVVMPAGLRGVHHLTSMAGADMTFSLQARIQQMAIEADPERICHIDEEIPTEVIAQLHKHPEFVRAYEEGALKPEEFLTFGVTQKTLSQFLWTGWVPLETYQKTPDKARWF